MVVVEYEAGTNHEISDDGHALSSVLWAWKTPVFPIDRAIVMVGHIFWTNGKESFRARLRCPECGGDGFKIGERDITIPVNAHATIRCVKKHEWNVYARR